MSRFDSVEPTNIDVKKRYPQLFNGLGQFGQDYEISLKEGVKPFALHAARNIFLPLRSNVQSELNVWNLWVSSPQSVAQPYGVPAWLRFLNHQGKSDIVLI